MTHRATVKLGLKPEYCMLRKHHGSEYRKERCYESKHHLNSSEKLEKFLIGRKYFRCEQLVKYVERGEEDTNSLFINVCCNR